MKADLKDEGRKVNLIDGENIICTRLNRATCKGINAEIGLVEADAIQSYSHEDSWMFTSSRAVSPYPRKVDPLVCPPPADVNH